MMAKEINSQALTNLVAILDKDIQKASSFHIEIFELCSWCGARFGIGYLGTAREHSRPAEEMGELPGRLIQILARDHWHRREHKGLIELDSWTAF
jgi:hypothetical protein